MMSPTLCGCACKMLFHPGGFCISITMSCCGVRKQFAGSPPRPCSCSRPPCAQPHMIGLRMSTRSIDVCLQLPLRASHPSQSFTYTIGHPRDFLSMTLPKKRIVGWLVSTPAPWVVGGDLNIGRWLFERAEGGAVGVISDCGNQRDCLFHAPDLPLQSLRCPVGRYFSTAAVGSISDAHNVVAAEVLLPSRHLPPLPVIAKAADTRPATPATPPEGLALTAHIPVAEPPLNVPSEAAAADARPSRLPVPELPTTTAPQGASASKDIPFAADARMQSADALPATLAMPEVSSNLAGV